MAALAGAVGKLVIKDLGQAQEVAKLLAGASTALIQCGEATPEAEAPPWLLLTRVRLPKRDLPRR